MHKIVYRLDRAPTSGQVQAFDVPRDARLLAVDWDTRNALGIAVWFRTSHPEDGGQTWHLLVRATGEEMPQAARYLGTVVRDGYAWHLFEPGSV